MSIDYSKLKGRIVEVCGTQSKFAELMDLSERTVSLKLNSKIPFNQIEIKKAIEVLRLTQNDIKEYFFKIKVQKIEQ